MKKIIFALLLCNNSFSQFSISPNLRLPITLSNDNTFKSNKALGLGLRVDYHKNEIGFNGGFAMQVNNGGVWNETIDDIKTEVSFDYSYFSIPLNVKYFVQENIYLYGGIEFQSLLSGYLNIDVSFNDSTHNFHHNTSSERSRMYTSGNLGLGFILFKDKSTPVFIEISYSNPFRNSFSFYSEKSLINNSLMFTLGFYTFE